MRGGFMTKDKIYDRLSSDLPINSVVAPAVVDDPLERGAKLRVIRSLRDDTLAYMHSHGQIDDAQLHAGREWQEYHENCEIGGARAIDPTKEAVDGGRFKEPDNSRYSAAFKALYEARKDLGVDGYQLIQDVLGSRTTLTEAAIARGHCSLADRKYVGRRFRECLESLAVLWGYAQRKTDFR